MIFKKILIFFTFLITSYFWTGVNQLNADLLGSKFTGNINFTGCSTSNCFSTGSISFSTGVYLKDITCKYTRNPLGIYATGSYLNLIISPNSSLTGNYHNYGFDVDKSFTTQFDLNYLFTGSSLYWKVTNFLNTGSGVNSYPAVLCYLNGSEYIQNSLTGVLDVNIKNTSLNTFISNTDPIFVTGSFNSSSGISYTGVFQNQYNEVFDTGTGMFFSGVRLFQDINYPSLHSNTGNDEKDIKEILYQILLIVFFTSIFHLTWLFYSFKNDLLGKK